MFKAVLAILAFALSTAATDAAAAPTACPAHFSQGEAPGFINQKLAAKSRALCFSAFALMHSGVARTAVWSAEYLTAERLADSKTMKRQNSFHPEERLPQDERAELRDYQRSGYDRGHLSPSGDMPDSRAQHESFSLANMVPQNSQNNQRLWSAIEEAVRHLARRRGALYVVTGPVFEGAALERINGRVLVPTFLFKAIYDPASGQAAAYLAPNAPGDEYLVLSIAELEQRTGLDVFPKLDQRAKQAGMLLPDVQPRARRR